MAVDPIATRSAGRANPGDVVLDGLLAGALGALAAALWFLIVDSLAGRPLFTPALLGSALFHRGALEAPVVPVTPAVVAAWSAVHAVVFVAIGLGFSWLLTRFERFPILGLVLLALALCLTLGFFVLDAALGARLLARLRPWSVIMANALAAGSMSLYLWRRHPRITEGVRLLWDDEP